MPISRHTLRALKPWPMNHEFLFRLIGSESRLYSVKRENLPSAKIVCIVMLVDVSQYPFFYGDKIFLTIFTN